MPLYPPVVDTYARYGWTAANRGFLAENYPVRLATGASVVATAGRVEITKIGLPVGASVTNIILAVTVAGNTLTAGQCFASLYTGAGVLIGTSADQAASWVSTGLKTIALASGPFACVAGNYYIAYWFNGTTGPTLARASGNGSVFHNAGFSSPNFLWATADTSITTTPPATLGAQTGSIVPTWAALMRWPSSGLRHPAPPRLL